MAVQLLPRGRRQEAGLELPVGGAVATSEGLAVRGEAQSPAGVLVNLRPMDLHPSGRFVEVERPVPPDPGEPLAVRGGGETGVVSAAAFREGQVAHLPAGAEVPPTDGPARAA